MRELVHPEPVEVSLPGVLHALADPARLSIVRKIAAEGELACGAACAVLPRSTLSHHFRVLREAGLIDSRREGTQMLSRLRRDVLDARFPGLLDSVLRAAAAEAPLSGYSGDAASGRR